MMMILQPSAVRQVALLAEGVGRNCCRCAGDAKLGLSPSSRRAWVEILNYQGKSASVAVALLAEGVGRNHIINRLFPDGGESPSSRRAWVEILA